MLALPCMLVCMFLFAQNRTRDRGCSKHPVPCALYLEGGNLIAKLGRNAPRDRRLTFSVIIRAVRGG